ncbi:hypothetical protein [Capnocytophaga canimorsus]|uniref:hypothetical protein n=1 Tax=Capnocytophaga canimorsus TaxID=28188 RepID=UPI0005898F66|nr:hypothetical protein [Capnocytophaga canimorsus]CEN50392.1 conserved hypothetical protein [Capnocytophaga canimorsus]VEJ20081.1 Uncharacterised protein [Capnocytophaga canimorsus]
MTNKENLKTEEIRIKLEKYFEGTSSLEEEKELKAYFTSAGVASELEQYRPLFTYMEQASQEQTVMPNLRLQKPTLSRWRIPLVAATFSGIVVLAGFLFHRKEQEQMHQAQLAYEQVYQALQIVSSNYNKGADKLVYLKEFETTTQKIVKTEKF